MQKSRLHHLSWLPWVTAAAVASAFLAGWYLVNQQETTRYRKATAAAAELALALIQRDLENRLVALQHFARDWMAEDDDSRTTWENDAANFLAEQRGYQLIEWVDSTMRIRWVLPLQGNESDQGADLTSRPDAWQAAVRARETRQAVFSLPMTLPQGDTVLICYLPLYRGNDFAGTMIVAARIIPWLDGLLWRGEGATHMLSFSIDGALVYGRQNEALLTASPWLEQRKLSIHGLDWLIRAAPAANYLPTMQSRLTAAILLLGLLLSAFTGWVAHAALAARLQTQQLHDGSNQLTTLLKNLPGMAFRFRNQENFPAEFVSAGCLELCGYDKAAFEQQQVTWGDIVHPEDRAGLWHAVQEAVRAGQPFENEYRIITRDGSERWVWSRGRLVHAEQDQSTFLDGLVSDITGQKQAAADLINAEAYAKAVVDTAAEAVITIDSSGRIETFNAAAQHMFGYQAEEIGGENVRVLMPEPHRSEHDRYIERYLETRHPGITGRGRDVTARRKDGTLFPVRVSISEVQNQTERKLVGLIRDLSEQRAAEQEARDNRERLAHVDRLNILGEMATGIAHEINQPLSAISMYAQSGLRFLDSPTPRPERLHEALQKLSAQAHRAGAIIERMQQLGKQRESRLEQIDGNELIREVHYLAETEARIRDMVIELDLCTDSGLIIGDPVQIQQVVLNLLRNGMESMETRAHRNENRIQLRTRCSEHGFTVFVLDSGVGVSDEVAAKLFQPFSTTKANGMGLGLSICRSIINAHGGQLGFINNRQGGATFYFTLPHPK